mgnify:CR=1 FL=1
MGHTKNHDKTGIYQHFLVKSQYSLSLPNISHDSLIPVITPCERSENAFCLEIPYGGSAAKGELPMEDFMADIENMVSELIHTYHEVSDEQKKMFAQGPFRHS